MLVLKTEQYRIRLKAHATTQTERGRLTGDTRRGFGRPGDWLGLGKPVLQPQSASVPPLLSAHAATPPPAFSHTITTAKAEGHLSRRSALPYGSTQTYGYKPISDCWHNIK